MPENQILYSIKAQILEHPWPWLASVAGIFFVIGLFVGGL